MLTIKNANHVPTCQQIKSFRSCATATGLPMLQAETGRLASRKIALAIRRKRRSWLAMQWTLRFARQGARLRWLPPSAD
jgi:hypothetical protein